MSKPKPKHTNSRSAPRPVAKPHILTIAQIAMVTRAHETFAQCNGEAGPLVESLAAFAEAFDDIDGSQNFSAMNLPDFVNAGITFAEKLIADNKPQLKAFARASGNLIEAFKRITKSLADEPIG